MRGIAGRRRSPQAPMHHAVIASTIASLFAGAARVGNSTSGTSRKFTGGGVQPQRFVRPAAPMPNDPEQYTGLPVPINSRRALNRARGQR